MTDHDDDDSSRRFLNADYWRGRRPKAPSLAGASLTDPQAGGRRPRAEDLDGDE